MSKKSEVLSIFLLKEDTPPADLIDAARSPTMTPVKVGSIDGNLFTTSIPPHPPRWVSFFGDAVDLGKLGLRAASSSAVLVLPVKDRLFAITFGYGRHLLNPLAIEATFGLRVALNSVPFDKIRSIDKKTFEGIATHTREQASKDTSIGDFGLDVERDILRAVVGTPAEPELGTRLAGMDALTATCKVKLDGLPELLARYLVKSADDGYKNHLPWIDHISEIRDKTLRASLDEELLTRIRSGNDPRPWLAIPDLLNWSDIGGFRYYTAKSAQKFPDIHLTEYLKKRPADTLSTQKLRNDRVYGISASSEQEFGHWPVHRCLYAEVQIDGATYLLNNGEWYEINRDFVKTVDETVKEIKQTDFDPISYAEGDDENDYNHKLTGSIDGACCFDQDMIHHGGGKSSIEFCDVYSPDRKLIHVKRYRGSAVLSHLFSQGVVSASTFVRDASFREKVNQRLPAVLRLKDTKQRPEAADYEVAYLIASRSTKPLSLPFFSRVTLRNARMQLAAFGYKVTVTKVQIS